MHIRIQILLLTVFGLTASLGCESDDATCGYGTYTSEDQTGWVDTLIELQFTRELEAGSGHELLCSVPDKDVVWMFATIPATSELTDDDITKTGGRTATFVCDVAGDFEVVVSAMGDDFDLATSMTTRCTYVDEPIADCGPDWEGPLGSTATFDGTGSAVPEGAQIQYYWTMPGTPERSKLTSSDLVGANTATPRFDPDVAGTYVLGLTVGDGTELSRGCEVLAVVSGRDSVD